MRGLFVVAVVALVVPDRRDPSPQKEAPPPLQEQLVGEWAQLHQGEMRENRERVQRHEPLQPIARSPRLRGPRGAGERSRDRQAIHPKRDDSCPRA